PRRRPPGPDPPAADPPATRSDPAPRRCPARTTPDDQPATSAAYPAATETADPDPPAETPSPPQDPLTQQDQLREARRILQQAPDGYKSKITLDRHTSAKTEVERAGGRSVRTVHELTV